MPKNIILRISQKGAAKTGKALKGVTSSVARLGAKSVLVGAGFAALSTKLAGDFQKSLLEVSTLMTKVNEHTLPDMSKELRSVASASGLALSSISKAKYDIVSAGFSSAADSARVLATASKLAVGGVTTAASAADLLTTALNAYGKTADEVNDVSDVLFTTVRLGKTTMDELGQSMGLVLPFAKSMNLSLRNVGAAMATLTASGINTAEATTSLKSAIIGLSAPADSAKEAMQAAGIEVIKFDDGTVNLVETIEQFKGMSPETIKKFIPNVTAIAGIQTLANNFKVLSKNVSEFETQAAGATETAFEKMDSAFNTQFSKIKNNMQNVMISIGDVIIEKIQPSIEQVNEEFRKLGDIGWDVVGATLKDNTSAVFNLVSQTFDIAARAVEMRVVLLAMNIKNELASIIPFSKDNSEAIAAFSKQVEIQSARDAEVLKNSWVVTYSFLVDQAQQRADAEAEIRRKAEELKKELAAEGAEAEEETAVVAAEKEAEVVAKKIEGITLVAHASKMAHIKAVAQSEEMIAQGLSQSAADDFVAQKKMQFEANVLAVKLGTVSSTMGALSQLAGQHKQGALVSKRLAQGEAIINTYAAANVALKHPAGPPWNFIAAAAVVAAGLANVAKIESAEFASGGIVPGSGTGDTVPAMLTSGEVILNQSQQENLVGGMGGITLNISAPLVDETVIDSILPAIKKAQRMNLA